MYTEPQGDRKHILAGPDRLDNDRKKEQMLSGDSRKRTRGGLQCIRVCAQAYNPVFMGKNMKVFMLFHECILIYVCVF